MLIFPSLAEMRNRESTGVRSRATTSLARVTHNKFSPLWICICGTLGRSESVSTVCSLRHQKSDAEDSWMACRWYNPFKRPNMADYSTPQQNIPMDFTRSCQVGKKEGWRNIQKKPPLCFFFFFFGSVLLFSSFYFLFFSRPDLETE